MRLIVKSMFCALSLAAIVACSSSDGGGAPGPGAGPDAGSPGVPDASAPAVDCPAPTAGPTVHTGDVKGDEVWTAAASPHVLDANVNIRDGAKLTIEPCAEVLLAKGAHLQVAYPITPNTGTLIAEGTAAKPIRF
ncbi:MAG TPA: hypothetical protein VLT33_15260, partial [Labilithrix sp.]|nr:hypothetical protein [Labilithrix sp.]